MSKVYYTIIACVFAALGCVVISELLSTHQFNTDGGSVAVCILIVICTAILRDEIKSLKDKNAEQEDEDGSK